MMKARFLPSSSAAHSSAQWSMPGIARLVDSPIVNNARYAEHSEQWSIVKGLSDLLTQWTYMYVGSCEV